MKGKKVTVYEAIKGKGAIRHKRYNPLKKKNFEEIYIGPEQKKEYFKKRKFVQSAKTGKAFRPPPKKGKTPQGIYKLDNPGAAYREAAKLIKSKKYPFINRAVNAKTKPTPNNETMRTSTTDKEIYPTVQMKNNKLQTIKKGAYNRAKERGNVAPIDKSVSPSDLSKGLSNLVGKIRTNKVSQKALGFSIGVMVIKKPGCPHRENGVGMSDIKGIKDIQVKGKKFIGVK